jgi:hypothetical protein
MVPPMKNKQTIEPRIGIDIGKVIMSPVLGGKADTSFLSQVRRANSTGQWLSRPTSYQLR